MSFEEDYASSPTPRPRTPPVAGAQDSAGNVESRGKKTPKLPTVTMGSWMETYEGSGDYIVLRGGKPDNVWKGLDVEQDYRAITSYHYRPINPIKGTKA